MQQAVTVVDASGMKCPLPVLKARKAMRDLQIGDEVRVISTDPASPLDFKHFCNISGNELLEIVDHGDRHEFLIRKSGS